MMRRSSIMHTWSSGAIDGASSSKNLRKFGPVVVVTHHPDELGAQLRRERLDQARSLRYAAGSPYRPNRR